MAPPSRPARTSPDAARVARLAALADQPIAQVRYAAQVLESARILASHGQILSLFAYVTQAQRTVADVIAECLRSLATIPTSLLPPLVERYRASEEEIILLGLFDLLLAHEARADYGDFLFSFLRDTPFHNIFRYLVSTLIAGRDAALIDRLAALAGTEREPEKRAILREALALR